jgi:DNA helicase HerA-like ATPase
LHLVGRETTNEGFSDNSEFCLRYDNLSPYAVMEILDLNEAQQARYLKAYDIAKTVLRRLKIFPTTDAEASELYELDEMERGYPRLTLAMMYDIVRLCARRVAEEEELPYLQSKVFYENRDEVAQIVAGAGELPKVVSSWRVIQGSLSRLLRLGIFDNTDVRPPDYDALTQPGRVTIIDLSDTDSPQINNLVISEILRGLRAQQEENYEASERGEQLRKVVVVIEEAHEFLSAERIKQMPVLFQQVTRIARRGRKRWFGLMFVTQLPQHLPDEVLGLVNNFLLHKIADSNVISRLKRSVGGVEDSLWNRLPNLAPGQAIVRAEGMGRSLLVAIDPTPSKLRMVE